MEQSVASTASSSTAKSPPSQKGDRTEEQSVASTASSLTAKSPPSYKGDRTDILFISFSSKNEGKVNELVSEIESEVGHGSCWTYLERNLPGDNLPQKIVDAINKADIMLCMITPDYIDSEPCEKEFLLAEKLKKHIIPLHLEKVLVPYKKKNGGDSPMQLDATNLVYARMYINNPKKELQKVIAKIKKCLPGKDANTSGRPSTAGRKKRKCSQDGDASGVKVIKKE